MTRASTTRFHFAICAGALLLLGGCGGGSGAVGNALPSHGATAPQNVVLKIVLPTGQSSMSATLRHALFVSSSTAGLLVTVYNHGTTTPVVAQ